MAIANAETFMEGRDALKDDLTIRHMSALVKSIITERVSLSPEGELPGSVKKAVEEAVADTNREVERLEKGSLGERRSRLVEQLRKIEI